MVAFKLFFPHKKVVNFLICFHLYDFNEFFLKKSEFNLLTIKLILIHHKNVPTRIHIQSISTKIRIHTKCTLNITVANSFSVVVEAFFFLDQKKVWTARHDT
jgi:hypothetical protein